MNASASDDADELREAVRQQCQEDLETVAALLESAAADPSGGGLLESAAGLVLDSRTLAEEAGLAELAATFAPLAAALATAAAQPGAADLTAVYTHLQAAQECLGAAGGSNAANSDLPFDTEPLAPAAISHRAASLPSATSSSVAAPAMLELDDPAAIPAELREIFAAEASDHLQTIFQSLAALESEPPPRDQVQRLRRAVHTLKGAAGAVGLRALTQLGHRMEDMLDRLYEGTLVLSSDGRRLLYQSADTLQDLLAGTYAAEPMRATLARLYADYQQQLAGTEDGAVEPAPDLSAAADAAALPVPAPVHEHPANAMHGNDSLAAARGSESVRVSLDRLDQLLHAATGLVGCRTAIEERLQQVDRTLDVLVTAVSRLRRLVGDLDTHEHVAVERYRGEPSGRAAEPADGGGREADRPSPANHGRWASPPHAPGDEFDTLELDSYSDLNLLSRSLHEATADVGTIAGSLRRLLFATDELMGQERRLTQDIYGGLKQIRMLPLATICQPLERAVRQVAGLRGQPIRLQVSDPHVAVDKSLLDAMSEPLLHLVRNAADHGVEPAAVRAARGKPAEGVVALRAYHDNGQVIFQVSDDGGGLDRVKIAATAVRRGLVADDAAAALTEAQVHRLLLLPGFSTADKVTETSGRGVGMDAVAAVVERLAGHLSIESRVGQGTTFTIRLPLTVSLMRVVLVRVGEHTYALPVQAVMSVQRGEASTMSLRGGQAYVRGDDAEHPVYDLATILGFSEGRPAAGARRAPVLLLRGGKGPLAVQADQVLAARDVVVTDLGSHLGRVPGVLGATILGEGTVVPILDAAALTEPSPPITGDLSATPLAPREPALSNDPTSSDEPIAPAAMPVGWAPSVPAIPAPPPAPPRRLADHLTIMLVDDSVSVRHAVESTLRSAGWTVLAARDGLEALELCEQPETRPDLFLVDIEMPRLDGFGLLQQLRQSAAFAKTPVVMLTSRAAPKHRNKAVGLGASDYLVKPCPDDVLLSTLRAHAAECPPAPLPTTG